jgi:2'-5' RNA ligase
VLWVGLDDRAGALAAIAGALDAAFAARVRPEARPFAAHLTVARSDPPLRLAPGTLSAPVAPVRFVVARLVLYRSHLGRPAPRYEPLGTFPLPGSG